jgi:hypothetical protein
MIHQKTAVKSNGIFSPLVYKTKSFFPRRVHLSNHHCSNKSTSFKGCKARKNSGRTPRSWGSPAASLEVRREQSHCCTVTRGEGGGGGSSWKPSPWAGAGGENSARLPGINILVPLSPPSRSSPPRKQRGGQRPR